MNSENGSETNWCWLYSNNNILLILNTCLAARSKAGWIFLVDVVYNWALCKQKLDDRVVGLATTKKKKNNGLIFTQLIRLHETNCHWKKL